MNATQKKDTISALNQKYGERFNRAIPLIIMHKNDSVGLAHVGKFLVEIEKISEADSKFLIEAYG